VRRSSFSVFLFIIIALFFLVPDALSEEARLVDLGPVHPILTPSEFRLFVEDVSDATYRVWHSQSPPKVIVDVGARPLAPKEIAIRDPAVERVRIAEGPLGARIVIDLGYALPRPIVEKEANGLLVVVPKLFQIVEEITIARGIVYGSVRAGEVHGPLSVKYLKVDPTRPGVSVRPMLSGDAFGRASLRDVVARSGAIAGLNGGFFHWSGRPLGLLIRDGELVSESIYDRTAFGIDGNGLPFIERLGTRLWIETPYGNLIVDGINRPRSSGEIVVYTADFGRLPQGAGDWLLIEDGRVSTRRAQEAPAEGFAINFDLGDPRLERLRPGDRLAFRYAVEPVVPGGVQFAIGGGPQIVRDGKVAITGVEERFQADVLIGRAPRSALGVTRDGQLLLVVVDGRSNGRSVGATLGELAELMIRLGAESAMNLDGGGSSTLVLNGIVLNQPSGGEERLIASAILVFLTDDAS